MPVAFEQETISQIWTAAQLRATFATKLPLLGFTQEYASGDDLIFSVDAPTIAPKDRAYLRINCSQPTGNQIKIQSWAGDGYSAGNLVNISPLYTDTISGSATISYTSGESFPLKVCTFKSAEIAWIGGFRSDNSSGLFNLGFLFPSVKPSDWPNSSLYAFHPSNLNANRLRLPLVNPVHSNYSDLTFGTETGLSGINNGGTRDLIKRLVLINESGARQVCAATSTDFALIAASGLPIFSQNNFDGQVYVNLTNNGGNTIAIRIL